MTQKDPLDQAMRDLLSDIHDHRRWMDAATDFADTLNARLDAEQRRDDVRLAWSLIGIAAVFVAMLLLAGGV